MYVQAPVSLSLSHSLTLALSALPSALLCPTYCPALPTALHTALLCLIFSISTSHHPPPSIQPDLCLPSLPTYLPACLPIYLSYISLFFSYPLPYTSNSSLVHLCTSSYRFFLSYLGCRFHAVTPTHLFIHTLRVAVIHRLHCRPCASPCLLLPYPLVELSLGHHTFIHLVEISSLPRLSLTSSSSLLPHPLTLPNISS